MASPLATIVFYALTLVALAVAAFLLFVLFSAASFAVLYFKEWVAGDEQPPIFGTVFHQLIHFDTLFDFLLRLARRNKTFRLIKLSHSEYFTADPAIVEHVLKTQFPKYSKGEYNYDIVRDLFGDGIFAVDGERWRHQRKLASYEFSTKVLRDFSSAVFRSNASKSASVIAGAAGEVVDMMDLMMKSTLDSIFKVGFGVELDTLSGSNERGTRFSHAFDESNHIVYCRFADVFWKLKRFLNVGKEAKLKENLVVIDDFVFQLIRHKREMRSRGLEMDKEDILSRFLSASEKEPERINDKYLRDIILNFLIAGKDTSGNTLTWFFYAICKYPRVQNKIAAEIRELTGSIGGDGRDADDFAEKLSDDVIEKMHYLHSALTETLRLYPAVPVDGKNADEDDVLPEGFKVKKGDGVNYMIYAMGRMSFLWGDDAEEFRPERWLDNGTFRSESQFKFIAFNAGPRLCLGKDFAYRQMKIMAAVLLHSFKFKLADESYVATYRTMFTLHMDKGLHVLATPRG